MTRVMSLLFGGFPISPATVRALAATMADWRHEAARAGSTRRRVAVTLSSLTAIVRALVGSAIRDLPGEWRSPFLWRLTVSFGLVLVAAALLLPPSRFAGVATPVEVFVLSLIRALIPAITLFPLMAFIVEATGSHKRRGPSLGGLLALVLGSFALLSVVLPEAGTFQRQATWLYFANASTPAPSAAPSLVRLLTGAETAALPLSYWIDQGLLLTSFTLASVCLAVLGYRIRELGRGPQWWHRFRPTLVCAGVVLTLVMALLVVFWPPVNVTIRVRALGMSMWLALVTIGALALASWLARRTESGIAS